MRKIIDIYDRIYAGLLNGLFANSEASEKATSALAIMSAIEWLYFFDAVVLVNKLTNVSDFQWDTFKPRTLLIGLGICGLNFMYMYPRRKLLEEKSSQGDFLNKYLVSVFCFYAIPIVGFAILMLTL